MAQDVFIKIGSIAGESRDAKHKNEIDVLSWSWGMATHGSAHVGLGLGAGKVEVLDLTFVKYIDKATPDLMLYCCSGKHIPESKLTVRKAGGNPLDYMMITMQDVIVTSVSTGGSGGEDRLTECVMLNFARVLVNYREQTATGGVGSTPRMGWDIAANTKM
jgi:type VI secretion system secreted protein Hcp